MRSDLHTPTQNISSRFFTPPQYFTPFRGLNAHIIIALLLFLATSLADAQTWQTVVDISRTSFNQSPTNSVYTVPAGGPYRYRITVKGGNGGGSNPSGNVTPTQGGRGGVFSSEYDLPSGWTLDCVAGSNGKSSYPTGKYGAGGGGASGAYLYSPLGNGPLIVAGGGGGAGGGSTPIFITSFQYHGGGDAIGYASAGSGGGGGAGFTNAHPSPNDWAGGGGGGVSGNGGDNNLGKGGKLYAAGGGMGGNSNLHPSFTSLSSPGGGGFVGGGGASVLFACAGGGGGGFTGGGGGGNGFNSSTPIGYEGIGGTSFNSTLGYNTSAFSITGYNSLGGSVKVEVLLRLSDFGTVIPNAIPNDLVFEFNQLEALYRATNGANWTNKTNWLTGGDMSAWHGVTLTADGKSVLKIELPSNNLTGGNIPNLNLDQLTTLNLRGNAITGAIPNFNYLPALTDLNLAVNQFSGSVPLFNNCTALQNLNLAINQLTGSVPNFLNHYWVSIDLGLNQLSGTLPALTLNILSFFSVYGNNLSGQIPNLAMPSLNGLNIAFNNFSGTLPTVLNNSLVSNTWVNDNNYNFGSLLNSPLLNGTIVYAPQKKMAITYLGGALEVNTGVPTGSTTQTFYWYKDNTVVAVNNNNWYRPTATGTYRVEVAHSTLTVGTGDKNLILISNNFTVSTLQKSNGGRNYPIDLLPCLSDDFNELEKIYDATGGANWTNKTNWLTSANIASWYGVWAMSADGCNVADLVLNSNNLNGILPNLSFPSATRLSFADNLLRGAIPTITAPNLKILGFSSNQMSGNIPNFNFTLDEFYINNNRFIYGNMEGKTWLNTPVLHYKDQAIIPTTLSNCALTVNTGSTATDQTFIWFRRNADNSLTEVTRGNSPQFTPSVAGTYLCHAYHFTLSRADIPSRNLVLVSQDFSIGNRLYVKPTQSGNGSGDSWANAVGGLQNALESAACMPSEIWVAVGTYRPSKNIYGNVYLPSHNTFRIPNGTLVYGSFAGTETNLSERTPSVMRANPSILHGDIFNDDRTPFTGAGSSLAYNLTNDGDNASHVVVFHQNTAPTRLDGFTVAGGRANRTEAEYNIFSANLPNSGGGIWNNGTGTNVTIANCRIVHNLGDYGGGMLNNNASPTVAQCIFETNRAYNHGGGMVNFANATPNVVNCVFSGNRAGVVGGGIANFSGSAMTLVNSTIVLNHAAGGGGFYNDNSNARINNSIIWANSVDGLNNYQSTPLVNNSIVQAAYSGAGSANNATSDPLFVNLYDPDGADNAWFTADDGLELGCNSSAFNTGRNDLAPATDILGKIRPQFSTVDMGAYEASRNIPPLTASINVTPNCGATTLLASILPIIGGETYAWSGGTTPSVASNNVTTSGNYTVTVTNNVGCSATATIAATVTPQRSRLYVNAANTISTKDGLTWATAFSDLQSALSACKESGAEIWVAAGTYKPSVDVTGNANPSNLRTRTFFVQGDVNIYGGFAGTETALSQRTPFLIVANPTILSGDFNGDDTQSGNGSGLTISNLTDNAYHVVSFSGTPSVASRLDGFRIRGGNANFGENYNDYGGGIVSINVGDKLTVANCVFQFNGGYYGGGMANLSGASPTVQNCVFDRNFALAHGGAVTNYVNSAPSFNNCVMTGNNALNVAGGVYNRGNCNATFNNTTLVGNAAAWVESGVIYNDASSPTITNSILWANAPNAFGTWAGGAPTVNHSIVQSGHAGTSNTNSDPVFTNISNPIGADNQWFTSDDGLRLACGSPAFNTGTTTTLMTDIIGTSRPQLSTNDRGAYESTANLFTLAPTANAAQSFCRSPTIANLVVTGTAVKWYDVATGGTQLSNTTALTNGSIYYASQTLNDCESVRTAVTVTVNALPTIQITGATTACNSVNLTATTTLPLGTGGTYAWNGGATPSVSSNSFTNSGTYTVTVTNAQGCSSTSSQAITVFKAADATLVLSNRSNVNPVNTTCTTDDYFTADITVNYTQKPLSGTLVLSGSDMFGTPPMAVNVSAVGATSYTFTGVRLRPDGQPIELSATFSDCYTATNTNLGVAPVFNPPTFDVAAIPNSINVSGFVVCPAETGVYTKDGFLNGAPSWRSNSDRLYWNGTRWEIVLQSSGGLLSYSTAGSATQFPCGSWVNSYGCGTPQFDFCGTFPATVNGISLDKTSACQAAATCNAPDVFTTDVTVNFTYAPSTGNLTLKQGTTVLATKLASELSCVTSWTFSGISLIANGLPIALTAEFNAVGTFTSSSLGNAPIECRAGRIYTLTASNISACNGKNTSCFIDDSFTADFTVTFNFVPSTGTLALSGSGLIGTPPSVSVANLTGNSYTFRGVNLYSAGAVIGLTATFSNGCSLANPNLGTAPKPCSGPALLMYVTLTNCNFSGLTLSGMLNNAPYWQQGNFRLYWTGTSWEFRNIAFNNFIFSYNTTGSITELPCSNWEQVSSCGAIGFSYCGTVAPPTNEISSVSIANTSPCQSSGASCSDNNFFTTDVTVNFAYAPVVGYLILKQGATVLGIKPAQELNCATTWTFPAVKLPANGAPIELTAAFSDGASFTASNLGSAPAACLLGQITSITAANMSGCDNKNTTPLADDTFTADVTVTFNAKPTTGNLVLSGPTIVGTTPTTVSVGSISGNSYTFSGVTLRANGSNINLTASFTNGCIFTNTNAGTALVCSSLPSIILVGGFTVCPNETGNYVQNGMLNGAPRWLSATDQLYWNGARWEIILRSNSGILSYSPDGNINNIPCTGWVNTYGCGTPTFNFCSSLDDIYVGTAACQDVSMGNVSGNQWYYFQHANGLVAAINPNGLNLGTVTTSISDATGAISVLGAKLLGRTINVTSSNYADGVIMPSNYTLRLFYKDTELTEYNAANGSNTSASQLSMAWKSGGSGCDWTTYTATSSGALSGLTYKDYGVNNDGFHLQFNLNHFTIFAPIYNSVLPVELLNFSGYTEGGQNRLVWTTANEINNKGFQVERASPQPPQGALTTWDVLGFVNTKGKAATYDFVDKAPPSGAGGAYYRLRQMDNDGKETLSKVISLSNTAKSLLKVYPNPATDVLTVEFTKGGTVDTHGRVYQQFQIINLLGQIILRGPLNQSVDVSSLPNGTYIVKVGEEQVKFIKQ
jgi:Secretion system C-terminal sorting domain/Ig-like domain CHU_C associated